MKDRSQVQAIFESYSKCEFLSGEAVADDDGTVYQSTAWLYENRFDDFLDSISYALVEGGVSRETLMQVFLRHALRILNENPNALHAGADDNRNAVKIIDELIQQCNSHEFLREKVLKIADRLPVPLGMQFK